MVLLISMLIKFINPDGRENQADLTADQIIQLRAITGYTIIGDRPRIHVSDSACFACE